MIQVLAILLAQLGSNAAPEAAPQLSPFSIDVPLSMLGLNPLVQRLPVELEYRFSSRLSLFGRLTVEHVAGFSSDFLSVSPAVGIRYRHNENLWFGADVTPYSFTMSSGGSSTSGTPKNALLLAVGYDIKLGSNWWFGPWAGVRPLALFIYNRPDADFGVLIGYRF